MVASILSTRFASLVRRTCTRFGTIYVWRTRTKSTQDELYPTRPPETEWQEKQIDGVVSSFYQREVASSNGNILRDDKRFITPEINIVAGDLIIDSNDVEYRVVATLTQHEVNGVVFALEFQLRS